MLGCHDFCGYYDWTFHYLRRRFGEGGVKKYWREAIAEDSQRHYIEAGQTSGLAGLYDCWNITGIDEQCDWTVELNEAEDLLQINMMQCPSKGFLLDNDLNADEDYCNHCMGWIGPALEKVGARVVAHEHNHCGQCYWQIVPADASTQVDLPRAPITQNPLWESGYLHRFENHTPVADAVAEAEADADAAENCFPDSVAIIRDRIAENSAVNIISNIISGQAFLKLTATEHVPRIVVLGYDDLDWGQLATDLDAAPSDARLLIVHPYLPGVPPIPFAKLGIPRPLPLLPTLIRAGTYTHQPDSSTPTTDDWVALLGQALGPNSQRLGLP